MRYFIVVILLAGLLFYSAPAFADSGVSISLTTTVIGSSGGSGDNGYVGSRGPSSFVDVTSQLPQSSSSYMPPQQPTYIPLPTPSLSTSTVSPPKTPPISSPSTSQPFDWLPCIVVLSAAVLIGFIVWWLSRRRSIA